MTAQTVGVSLTFILAHKATAAAHSNIAWQSMKCRWAIQYLVVELYVNTISNACTREYETGCVF